MKKIITLALFAFSLCLAGCGPSLGEYVAQSNNYFSSVATGTTASVLIESKQFAPEGNDTLGSIGAAFNLASSVSAAAVSHEQDLRLRKLISSNEINTQVASGFNDGFANSTHLVVVDNSAHPDLRIMLNVTAYGLWAESILDPMNFYIECDIQIIHTASMKQIYSDSVFVRREVQNLFSEISNDLNANVTSSRTVRKAGYKTAYTVAGATSLLSGAANLTAFFELTDEQIVEIFSYMAYDAGMSVARQLINEIYD